MISAPICLTSSGESVLTDAWVPTGMYTGVSIVPWGVCSLPRRAPVFWQTCSSSKSKGFGKGGSSLNY